MKAAPDAQRRLLDLQGVDTSIARVRHRRAALPEHAEIARLQSQRVALAEEVVANRTRVSDLEAEQEKAESDLQPVRDRLARDRRRVEDGSVTDPKALQAILEEIEHLLHRISDLEDAQLEGMERLEAAQGALGDATARKTALEDVLRAALARRDEKLQALGREVADFEAERASFAATIPADLLALYARIAERSGGVGAAWLEGGRCGGCQLEATSADLGSYRASAPDEVLRCEECGRILVRPAESGQAKSRP